MAKGLQFSNQFEFIYNGKKVISDRIKIILKGRTPYTNAIWASNN